MDKKRFRYIVCVGTILVSGFFLTGFKKIQATTENGVFDISVEVPDSVKVGRNAMELSVVDKKTGAAGGGKLKIEAAPWMPVHQHGSSEAPVIKEKGKDRYLIERLNFTMPGEWEVYIRINDGNKEDTAVITVDVK
ncbi:MAG: FixH family protein [Candidatus Sulfobium sp.]|jgi:hypothetical protein